MDPVVPRLIELEDPLVKPDEPDVNLNPVDEMKEGLVAADDPLEDSVFNNDDPLSFEDGIALKVEIKPPLPELGEPEPDANCEPLDELTDEPVDVDDALEVPVFNGKGAPVSTVDTALRVEIRPLLAELEELAPGVNLNPKPVDSEDPLDESVLINGDPMVFKDDTALIVEIRPLLAELELKPDANIGPLDELVKEPVDDEGDPLVAPDVNDDDPLLALKAGIKLLLAELEVPEVNEIGEPRLSVEENPE